MLPRLLLVAAVTMIAPNVLAFSMPVIDSAAPQSVALTVYRDNSDRVTDLDDNYAVDAGLVMVTEHREVDLPQGRSRIVFRNVSDRMIPKTAKLIGLDGHVLENNFDYQVVTPGEIINHAIGSRVMLTRTNRKTGIVNEQAAVIRSGPNGVVLDVGGRVEALGCSGEIEKIVFDSVPDNLVKEPTLSVNVQIEHSGHYDLQLTYLALGVQWKADYVARINQQENTLDLDGEVTLINAQSTTFEHVPVQLVAGKIEFNRYETRPPQFDSAKLMLSCWPVLKHRVVAAANVGENRYFSEPGASTGDELEEIVVAVTELGDYKQYSLPFATTVAAREAKQISFLQNRSIPFEKLYRFRNDFENLHDEMDSLLEEEEPVAAAHYQGIPNTILKFQNTEQRNLGIPLPSGNVSLMESSTQRYIFVGQGHIGDIPKGLPVELELGRAFDVWVENKVTAEKPGKLGMLSMLLFKDIHIEAHVDSDIHNDKSVPVTFEYIQTTPKTSEVRYFKVKSESRYSKKGDDFVWRVTLKPGEHFRLSYDVVVGSTADTLD